MARNLPLVPRFIEKAIQRFADKRLSKPSHHAQINRHQLYILPTKHGMMFFIVLLLILFGAINYENSLGFMLAFLLGSLGLLGMVHTHQNINKLNIQIGRAESVFAGQNIKFPITLSQNTNKLRPGLQLLSNSEQVSNAHLYNESSTNTQLILKSHHRGYVSPGRVKLFTEFPLGLFHAWSWLNLDSQCLVYPAPYQQHAPINQSSVDQAGTSNNVKQGVDDFSGIRQYQSGDLPNHMAWKAIAKTGKLQTKLFNNDASKNIWISWSELDPSLDIEKRLSILCRMVLDASEQSHNFGLDIPGTKIQPSHGLQHKQQCLKALALFGL